MSERVQHFGKDVLLDGKHLCRCRDSEAAFVVSWCLAHARSSDVMPSYHVAADDERRVQEFFA